MSNPLLAMLNASASQAIASPSAGSATPASQHGAQTGVGSVGTPRSPASSSLQPPQHASSPPLHRHLSPDRSLSQAVSANDLLARLRATSSATSIDDPPLASTLAHQSSSAYNSGHDITSAQAGVQSPQPPPMLSPPSNPSQNANDLLQALLLPRNSLSTPTQPAEAAAASPFPDSAQQHQSAQAPSSVQTTSAQNLLALLGDPLPLSPHAASTATPAVAVSAQSQPQASHDGATATSASQSKPSGVKSPAPVAFLNTMTAAPAGRSTQTQSAKTRAQVPTIFDHRNMFDLLSVDGMSESGASTSTATTANRPQPAAAKSKAAPASASVASDSSRAPSAAGRSKGSQQQAPQPSKAEPDFEDDRNRHARRHLVGLRASSGFDDDISSGLTRSDEDGVQQVTLDLLAPQPAGCGSLYAAKLEITPISLLPVPFAPPVIAPPAKSDTAQRWPKQTIAALGPSVILYSMNKGRIRIIHKETGVKGMVKLSGGAEVSGYPSIFCGHGLRHSDGRSWWSFGAINGARVGFWILETTFGQREDVQPVLVFELDSEGRQTVQAEYIPGTDDCEVATISATGFVERLILPAITDKLLTGEKPASVPIADAPGNTISMPQTRSDFKIAKLDNTGTTLVSVSNIVTRGDEKKLCLAFSSVKDSRAPEETFDIVLPGNLSGTTPIDSLTILGTSHVLLGFEFNTTLLFVDIHKCRIDGVVRIAASDKKHFVQLMWEEVTSTIVLSSSLRSSIFTARPFLYGSVGEVKTGLLEAVKAKTSCSRELALDTAFKECVLEEPWLCVYPIKDTNSNGGFLRLAGSSSSGLLVAVLGAEAMMSRPRKPSEDAPLPTLSDTEMKSARESTTSAVTMTEASLEQETPSASTHNSADAIDVDGTESASESAEANEFSNARAIAAKAADDGIISSELLGHLRAMESNILDAVVAEAEESNRRDTLRLEVVAPTVVDMLKPVLASAFDEAVHKEVLHRVVETVRDSLPQEIAALILRADITAHLGNTISASIVPTVQKTAMDVVSRVLAPHFEEVMGDLTVRVERKIDSNLTSIRKDIVAEQGKALIGTEAAIGSLIDEVSKLQKMTESLMRQNAKHEETIEKLVAAQSSRAQELPRPVSQQPALLSMFDKPAVAAAGPSSTAFSRQPSQTSVPHHMSQPSAPTPQAYASPAKAAPAVTDVEDALIEVLSAPTIDHDASRLRNVLISLEASFGAPRSAIFDEQGKSRVSQAVILTLLHRLVKALNKAPGSPAEIMPEQAVPWIEGCCLALDRNDQTVAPYLHGLRSELVEGLVNAHIKFAQSSNRLPWWTQERLGFGALQYLQ